MRMTWEAGIISRVTVSSLCLHLWQKAAWAFSVTPSVFIITSHTEKLDLASARSRPTCNVLLFHSATRANTDKHSIHLQWHTADQHTPDLWSFYLSSTWRALAKASVCSQWSLQLVLDYGPGHLIACHAQHTRDLRAGQIMETETMKATWCKTKMSQGC